MKIENIETERLLLIPFTLESATSILKGDQQVLIDMGLTNTEHWPDQEALDTLPKIIRNLELVPEPTGFESWMIVLKASKTVIGDGGFKGRPNKEGEVDLGYAIIEQEQKKGYGAEAAKTLMNWALNTGEVKAVTANCLVDNIPSARILQKLGMEELHRDDEMIYWAKTKPQLCQV